MSNFPYWLADDVPGERAPSAVARRDFLKLGLIAGGGLMLGLHRLPLGAQAAAPAPSTDPLLYVRIHADGRIVIGSPKSEMGQGVRTSLAMLVAEELEADWSQVVVETLPLDARLGDQGTGGSHSINSRHESLRRIGASLREILVAAAAARWQVEPSECEARDSIVRHPPSGRTARYAELIEAASRLVPPAAPALKPRSAWRLLGTPRAGKDCADITHGRARYGIDVRLPGMLFAQIERPSRFGARVAAMDAAAASKVPGVRKVFVLDPLPAPANVAGGVVVVADSTWAAAQGRAKLQVRWDEGAASEEGSATISSALDRALDAEAMETVNRIGDPEAALAAAGERVMRADYRLPFLAHASLEPQNATAHWHDGRMTIWSPTQFAGLAARSVARNLGIEADRVTLNVTLLGGSFGRRINADFTLEAALVAHRVDAPVQVVWTREDDFRHDFYRPVAAHRLRASLDAEGRPAALVHRLAGTPIGSTYDTSGRRPFGGEETVGIADTFYRVPLRSSGYTPLASKVPRGWWRGVHTTHTTFAIESFIDELAKAAGQDPLDYRLALIDTVPVENPPQEADYTFDPARMRACLQRAARMAEWHQPAAAGRARGLACVYDHRGYAAVVIEAGLRTDEIVVHRATCVVDCGLIINPDGARAQVEGSIVQGLSAALGEAITLDRGAVVEGNFHQYRILRIDEAPLRIEVGFIEDETRRITGLGEPALPAVAPALANAVARLTGRRCRQLPLRAALTAAGATG